ncbi:MAG TPA: hypothetical protein VFC31_08300 [Candidatus Limnocylindria bacterium]|nr:hypothetical protein [Candidatus Limnocylindria bacterium]
MAARFATCMNVVTRATAIALDVNGVRSEEGRLDELTAGMPD